VSQFDITGIVSQIGEDHYIVETTKVYNAQGDATITRKNYSIRGIVQVMDGSEDEVKEGLLQAEDIIVFYDDQQSELTRVKLGNQIYYNGRYYKIKNVITQNGHLEVHAKKL